MSKLGFHYKPLPLCVRYLFKDGKWDEGLLTDQLTVELPVGGLNLKKRLTSEAVCLNYGQAVFEGLKAIRSVDGKVRVFRPKDHAQRLIVSCQHVGLEPPTEHIFLTALNKLLSACVDMVPPFEDGALYLRPLVLGSGPQLGLSMSSETLFLIYSNPVGHSYNHSQMKAMIPKQLDRAAPFGSGHTKIGGNYAPMMPPSLKAQSQGYSVLLFVDAKSRQFIEEFATSNFIGVKYGPTPVLYTPESPSILPSITNKSILTLAEDLDWKVERRPIRYMELADMDEFGAVGTAVGISFIKEIYHEESQKTFTANGTLNLLNQLKQRLIDIQTGALTDSGGWTMMY